MFAGGALVSQDSGSLVSNQFSKMVPCPTSISRVLCVSCWNPLCDTTKSRYGSGTIDSMPCCVYGRSWDHKWFSVSVHETSVKH